MTDNRFLELCFMTNCSYYNPKSANFKKEAMSSTGKNDMSKEGTGSCN